MRDTVFTDKQGRLWAVRLPEGLPDSDANMGIPVGPPSLESLGLPEEIEIALHNQLYSRKIFTSNDIRRHRQDVTAAVIGALKLEVDKLLELYLTVEGKYSKNGANEAQ